MKDQPREYRKRREQQLINSLLRPVYYTCKDAIDEYNLTFSYTPFLFRADRGYFEASGMGQFRVSDRLLDALVNGYPKSEYWIDLRRQGIFSRLISYFGGHSQAEVNRILDYFMKTKFYSNPTFVLSVANNLYYFKNYELARRLYERAEELSLGAFSPTDLAVYCHILANARNYDKALGICIHQEQSSASCEANTVNSQQTIAAIYREKGEWSKVAEYSRKIIECQPNHKIAQKYLKMATERSH